FMGKSGLSDYRDTARHSRARLGNRLARDINAMNAGDLETRLHKMLDIALLVRGAALQQDLEKRIVPYPGLFQSSLGHGSIQGREVAAIEKADQIGRAQLE